MRADVKQHVSPETDITNMGVGRTSRIYQYYLEGTSELSAGQLDLALWYQGSSILDGSTSAPLRVADGKAQMWCGKVSFAGLSSGDRPCRMAKYKQ